MVITRTGKSSRRASQDEVPHFNVELEGSSEDDMPEEITSKIKNSADTLVKYDIPLLPNLEEPQSIYEQVKLKRQAEAERVEGKKEKEKSRKKAKKIAKGVFQVKESKAQFRVVTLKEGVKHPLEPKVNYKDELLKARTTNSRVKCSSSYAHRAQWVAKRS